MFCGYLRAAILAIAVLVLSAFFGSPARADCVQSGNTVTCTATDTNGFIRRLPNIALNVLADSSVFNVDTGLRNGECPLSFPGIALGADANVLNQGTILTSGICGWAIEVGDRSTVTSSGVIGTRGDLGFGFFGDNKVTATNTQQIVTTGTLAIGIYLGSEATVFNRGGLISTTGTNAAGIDVLNIASVTNTGTISATGALSSGISTAADSAVTNKNTVFVTGQHAVGVRMSGGAVTLNNSGTISAIADTLSLAPDAGVLMRGETVNLSNSGNIVASGNAANVGATTSVTLTNSGEISSRGEVAGSAAILIDARAGTNVSISNTFTINGFNGSAAVRALGGNVSLSNAGYIAGDILMGPGDDSVFMEFGTIEAFDGGAGNDTLVLGNVGTLRASIRNVETLRVFTPGIWRIQDTAAFTVVAGLAFGTLQLDPGSTLVAPLVDLGQGSFLRGFGTLNGAVISRGTLAPGSATAPGTITTVGSYSQTPTGTLALRLRYSSQSDRLVVLGPAALNGTLSLNVTDDATSGTPKSFDLITASNGISGAFSTVRTNSMFLRARIFINTPNVLSAEITRVPYASVAYSRAQRQAGEFLDTVRINQPAALAPIFAAIDASSSDASARGILTQLAPETFPALQNTALFTLAAFREAGLGKATTMTGEPWHAWGTYFLRGGYQTTSTQNYTINGGVAGIAKTLANETSVGFEIGHGSGVNKIGSASDEATLDATFVGVTAIHTWSKIRFETGLIYGGGTAQTQRLSTLSGATQVVSASPSTNLLSFYSAATIERAIGPLIVTPRMGLAYDRVMIGAANENVALSYKTDSTVTQTLRGEIGLNAVAAVGNIRPYGGVSASLDVLNEDRATPVTLNGASSLGFTLIGEKPQSFSLGIEGGIRFVLAKNLTGSVGGRVTANDVFAGHSVNARLLWLW